MNRRTLLVVGAIFIKDKKMLIVKPRKKDVFQMPGGKVEEGETLLQAIIRESHEELGPSAIFDETKFIFLKDFIGEATYEKDLNIHMHLFLYNETLEGELTTSDEIEKFYWFKEKDSQDLFSKTLKTKIIPYVLENNILNNNF